MRYATGIDRRDWPLFRTVFTDDCELDYGEVGSWKGVDAVTEFMQQAHSMAGHTMHRLTNQVITVDGDKAQSRTYVDALIMVGDNNSGVNAAGFYDDELVRTDDGWQVARRRFIQVRVAPVGDADMTFAAKYGPWALVAGASDGVGAAFAEGLAERGVNVVLLARRQAVLDEVAAGIADRTGVETRTLAVDLAEHDAASQVADATDDLDIGFLVVLRRSRPELRAVSGQLDRDRRSDGAAQLHRADAAVPSLRPARWCSEASGGIVLFGSGAGLAGGPNMVAYGATKAFDMVFAEALWSELHDKGVDVLGLILGKTDTPALRRLEHSRGVLSSEDQTPPDAAERRPGHREAFENLSNGPTLMVGDMMRAAVQMLSSVTRNEAVKLHDQAQAAAMGSDNDELRQRVPTCLMNTLTRLIRPSGFCSKTRHSGYSVGTPSMSKVSLSST